METLISSDVESESKFKVTWKFNDSQTHLHIRIIWRVF